MKNAARAILILAAISIAAPAIVLAAGGGEHAAPHAPTVNWTDGFLDVGGRIDPVTKEPANPPFVAVLINFSIFVGLLVWKAGPPISKYLGKRHDEIKGALAEAARMQKDAADTLADRKAKLGAVDAEVDDLIEGMRSDGESEKKRMVADAETAATALKRDAEGRIAASVTRARLAIEAEVVAAAIDAAEVLIRERSNDDDHNALVESFIESLTNGTFGGDGDGGGGPSAPPPPSEPPASVDEGWS